MVQISVHAHKFRGEDQKKKGLRREILGFYLADTCIFCPEESRLYSRLGGTSNILGGTGPEMHSGGIGQMRMHSNGNFLLGHNPRLGGHKQ